MTGPLSSQVLTVMKSIGCATMTRGPTRYVVRTPEQILPYCVIKTEHTGGSKSAGMPVTTKSNKAANSKPMVAMSKPKVQVAGKIKPKVAARDRRRARSAQLPPECQNPPWCAIM